MLFKADDDRATLWFLLASGLYFFFQAAQRTWMGGTMEVDEAEMMLLAREWAWGYGPQLPLYNWVQVGVFRLFGQSTASLAFLKDAVLWLAGAGLWFAMRAAFHDRRAAAVATLSMAFLPNVLWEFQRASTHSVALLAAITWTIWAWFRLMARQDMGRWLVLGVMMGLGGLAKTNYWVLPIGLAIASIGFWPQRVQGRGAALAVLVAGLIVALPYHWAITHPSASLASVYKFYGDVPVSWPWVMGLARLTGNMVAGLSLAMLIGGVLWFVAARGRMGPAPVATQILMRVVVLNLAVAVVLIVALNVSKVQARWLLPIQICAVTAAFGWLGGALSQRAWRWVPITALICGLITIVGMAGVRLGPTGARDMTPLVELVIRLNPDRVEGTKFLAGNLKLLQPDRAIFATGYTAAQGDWPHRLLILGSAPPALPAGFTVLEDGVLQLTTPAAPDKPFPAKWHLVGPPG